MTTHPEGMARIECAVDGDPRLIAGAATIVAHVARRAGLADLAVSQIADAAAQTCTAVLESIAGMDGHAVRLAAAEFANRIEVTVEPLHGGNERQPSAEQSRHFADRIRQTLKSTADGLNVEVQEGFLRVTLAKNSGAVKRPFVI